VEEPSLDDEVYSYPVKGAGYCPDHGPTETKARPGSGAPVHLGPFLGPNARQEYPPRGESVWRTADGGERGEMVRGNGDGAVFFRMLAGLRWDRASGQIVPIKNVGEGYAVRPESVDRERGTLVPKKLGAHPS
jgi:hypothetical protein